MKFTLEIKCENDAFAESPINEVRNILLELAEDLRFDISRYDSNHIAFNGSLMDVNGNKVGFYKYE